MSGKIPPIYKIPVIDGRLIRRFRKAKQMSQERLAALVDVAVETINRVENRVGYTPSNSTLERIAQKLDIPPVNFFHPQELDIFLAGRLPAQELPELEEPEAPAAEASEPLLDAETWERYHMLPAELAGTQLRMAFLNDSTWSRVPATESELFDSYLRSGSCVSSRPTIQVEGLEERVTTKLYAGHNLVQSVLDLSNSVRVDIVATALHGVLLDQHLSVEPGFHDAKEYTHVLGFVIDEIRGVETLPR